MRKKEKQCREEEVCDRLCKKWAFCGGNKNVVIGMSD